MVFVDDGFFGLVKKHFQKETKKRGCFLQTFRNICKNENLNLKHLFFYTAPPYQNKISDNKEDFLKKKYDLLVKMLKNKKWITVREGRCQRLKIGDEFKYFQKGVDSWIVADMCLMKEDFPEVKKIILISSDSDFAPIIKYLKERNKFEVILYTYFDKKRNSCFSLSNYLLQACSKWVRMTSSFFNGGENA
ncbi:MAG: NYN domain-containing protein [archaeon]